MITVDRRCFCTLCEARTRDVYRMIGACSNCGTGSILMLFRAGDKSCSGDCPICGCHDTVRPSRLATPDEFPEAESTA